MVAKQPRHILATEGKWALRKCSGKGIYHSEGLLKPSNGVHGEVGMLRRTVCRMVRGMQVAPNATLATALFETFLWGGGLAGNRPRRCPQFARCWIHRDLSQSHRLDQAKDTCFLGAQVNGASNYPPPSLLEVVRLNSGIHSQEAA